MSTLYSSVLDLLHSIRPEVDFTASSDFAQDGILDSFYMVTLVSALDNKIVLSIDGADIIPENFCNLDTIVKLLIKY